jgi:hypothetical protein
LTFAGRARDGKHKAGHGHWRRARQQQTSGGGTPPRQRIGNVRAHLFGASLRMLFMCPSLLWRSVWRAADAVTLALRADM